MNKMGNDHTNGQSNKEQLATDTHDNMDILKNALSKRSQAEKNIYSILKKVSSQKPLHLSRPLYMPMHLSVQTWTV